ERPVPFLGQVDFLRSVLLDNFNFRLRGSFAGAGCVTELQSVGTRSCRPGWKRSISFHWHRVNGGRRGGALLTTLRKISVSGGFFRESSLVVRCLQGSAGDGGIG